jgi:transcriptional regulator with XRE-family HTH domain
VINEEQEREQGGGPAGGRDLGHNIGNFIRDLRRNAGVSLRQLADKAGVSNPYLSQIERGLRKPSAEVLQQIAGALRVSTPACSTPRTGRACWPRSPPTRT